MLLGVVVGVVMGVVMGVVGRLQSRPGGELRKCWVEVVVET